MDYKKLWRNIFVYEHLKKNPYSSTADLIEEIRTSFSFVDNVDEEVITPRVLKSNLGEIEDLFCINIEYSPSKKGHYIEESDQTKIAERALESLQFYYLMKNVPDALKYIRFSPRKAFGTEFFVDILKAIEDNKKVRFLYEHYEKKEITERIVSPLGLKEFKGFWYLIADDKGIIKVFGLDRITGLAKYNENARRPKDFDMDEYFKHCYGIVRFPDSEPEEVLIKMKPIKAAYYKANPLHHSQKIVEENKDYVVVSLYVYYTYDLKQELRSHLREELEVIQPKDSLNSERYY